MSIPVSVPTRSQKSLRTTLLQASPAEWVEAMHPVVAQVTGFLPSEACVDLVPKECSLEISWAAGPSSFDVSALISDLVGSAPTGWEGNVLCWGSGLQAVLQRSVPDIAYGFALLSAALGTLCPVCSGEDDGEFRDAYRRAASLSDGHLLSTHQNLVGAATLGLLPGRIESVALVAGTLVVDALTAGQLAGSESTGSSDLGNFFHAAGHLPGLVRKIDMLTC